MTLSMLINLKASLKASLMNTSKKVVPTEAAQALDPSPLTNGRDLRTDHGMAEGTLGIEALMTVVVTDVVVEVVALTKGLEAALIKGTEEVVVDTVGDAEEDTMTEGSTVEEEVMSLKYGTLECQMKYNVQNIANNI